MSANHPAVVAIAPSLVVRDGARVAGIVNPRTGELVPLDAGTDELAGLQADLGDVTSLVREAQGETNEELLRRLDKRAQWTAEIGGYRLKAPSPTAGTESYDREQLEAILERLVAEDLIDPELAAACINRPPPPAPSVSLAGVKRALKLGGRVAEQIAEARRVTPVGRRTVKVERAQRER